VTDPAGVDEAILDAVYDLFMTRGYGGFSMAEVAARAGVDEAVVSSKGARPDLVIAAFDHHLPPMACPDTGSLRGDLLELLRWQIEFVQLHGPAIAAGLRQQDVSVELAAAGREMSSRRRSVFLPIFERAVARGELPKSSDATELLDFVLGPVNGRQLYGHPLDGVVAEDVVDLVLAGLGVAA